MSVPWEIPRDFEASDSSNLFEAADRIIRRSADQLLTLVGPISVNKVYFFGAGGAAAGATAAGAAAAGAKAVSTRLIMSSVMSIAGSA